MKKTLVALAVTAFATSASALTVLDADGTKVDFNGSVRVLLENGGSKTVTYDANGNKASTVKTKNHSNLRNDGTRFNIRAKHDLAEDLFAFGRLEFRFNGKNSDADKFGDLFAHRAYVGIGSKQFGELSFGRQVTIGDDISQTGFDNTFDVTPSVVTTDGKQVIRYDYKGIEGLQVGADYRFGEERDANGEVVGPKLDPITNEVKAGKLKSGYGLGAVYAFDNAKVAVGYTRDNYATGSKERHNRDAAILGGKYTIDALTVAADYGYSIETNASVKERTHYLSTGAKYQFTPEVAAYAQYAYARGDEKLNGEKAGKERSHGVMLGAEYQVHKNVLTFVEGKYKDTKEYNADGKKASSTRDNAIGVGLRVFW